MHKKILLMPSWYPNRNLGTGSFFKEQAAFLNAHGFDVKVLMCEYLHTKSYIYQRFKRLLKGQVSDLTTNYLDQDPEALSFPVILQKNWSEQKKIKAQDECYLKAFDDLLQTGWVPDLIHVQGTFRAGFSAYAISTRYTIPYVVIEHSPFNLAAHKPIYAKNIKEVLMKAHKVAGVSAFQKERLIEDGIDRDIEVVWNFMDESNFTLKTETGPKDTFVISTITTPAKVKDVTTFFKAISVFTKGALESQKIEVIVVGNNAISNSKINTSYFEDQAKTYGVAEFCRFVPYLERKEVINLMQQSDVFISTSINEPYGVAIREAMLCGTPVISTRSGGPEDSINTLTGSLVDIGDFNGIAHHLSAIYEGSDVFNSEYIRNYVISQSGREAFIKKMTNFYTIQ